MLIISWLITVLVAALLVTFVVHILRLSRLPTAQRPRTRTYDRFGAVVGVKEKPDYHVNPGEDGASDAT